MSAYWLSISVFTRVSCSAWIKFGLNFIWTNNCRLTMNFLWIVLTFHLKWWAKAKWMASTQFEKCLHHFQQIIRLCYWLFTISFNIVLLDHSQYNRSHYSMYWSLFMVTFDGSWQMKKNWNHILTTSIVKNTVNRRFHTEHSFYMKFRKKFCCRIVFHTISEARVTQSDLLNSTSVNVDSFKHLLLIFFGMSKKINVFLR